MQVQERELISGLFDRLKPFEIQSRDGEAETLIRSLVAQQPAAPYLLVQTVLVQEQALKAAQERIAELEARTGAATPAATGFLANAPKVGPWGGQVGAPASAPRSSVPSSVPSSLPSTRSPLQAAVAPPAAGGSFLRTAMATAAGVAGGALLFEGIRNLMGSNPGPFGGQQQAAAPQMPPPPEAPQQQAFADEPLPAEEYDTASVDDGGAMDDDSWA